MDDGVKEFVLSHLVFISWVAVFPLSYVFQFWLSSALAYGAAVVIAGLSSYALARKVGMSFLTWVGFSLMVAVITALLFWLRPFDSAVGPFF
jgi:hypothetical protein